MTELEKLHAAIFVKEAYHRRRRQSREPSNRDLMQGAMFTHGVSPQDLQAAHRNSPARSRGYTDAQGNHTRTAPAYMSDREVSNRMRQSKSVRDLIAGANRVHGQRPPSALQPVSGLPRRAQPRYGRVYY